MSERAELTIHASPNGSKSTITPVEGRRKSKELDHRSPNKENGKDEEKGAESPPKKRRRKVNHACVYCRRSHMTCDLERPCARCIKRDIGHLCHDEPREPAKRSKSEAELAPADEAPSPKHRTSTVTEPFHTYEQVDGGLDIGPPQGQHGRMDAPQIAQPKPVSPTQMQRHTNNNNNHNRSMSSVDWTYSHQNQFQDMHNLVPNYMFNTSEAKNEYNMLNDFLSTSLIDDGALWGGEDAQALYNDPLLAASSIGDYASGMAPPNNNQGNMQSLQAAQAAAGSEISRPSSTFPVDSKARDKFYMTAADPAGNDTSEERMNKLLKAKHDAGMLKPFNYVKGYARLNQYMERNLHPASRQKILRQLDKFRPKFREAMHTLTDIQLVLVEMWFERSLMEYDRVFASMAIPACCWRRTGEIYRGNKEMAELIHVPIEQLRDVSFGPIFAKPHLVILH